MHNNICLLFIYLFFYSVTPRVIAIHHIDVMAARRAVGGRFLSGTSHEGDSIFNVHMDKSIDLEVDRA